MACERGRSFQIVVSHVIVREYRLSERQRLTGVNVDAIQYRKLRSERIGGVNSKRHNLRAPKISAWELPVLTRAGNGELIVQKIVSEIQLFARCDAENLLLGRAIEVPQLHVA